jgi:hypothetical protein
MKVDYEYLNIAIFMVVSIFATVGVAFTVQLVYEHFKKLFRNE